VLAIFLLKELVGAKGAIGIADPSQSDGQLGDVIEIERVGKSIDNGFGYRREEALLSLTPEASESIGQRFRRHSGKGDWNWQVVGS